MVYRVYITIKYVVIGIIIAILVSATTLPNVYASGLGRHDFDDHPEEVCIKYGNDPEMEDLCSEVDICDEDGEINSTHGFCTNQRSCGSIEDVCKKYPDSEGCTVTRHLGVPNNEDPQNCERSVPDHCIEPYVETLYSLNGTQIQGNDLSCYDVKPLSDFRETIEDTKRHQFDNDYDGIGCENNDDIIFLY